MKLVLLTLAHAFIITTHQQEVSDKDFQARYKTSKAECMEEYHLEEVPDDDLSEESVTNDFKCYVKCLKVKLGLMNEDGTTNIKETLKHMNGYNKDVASNILQRCNERKVSDACETAYEVSMCAWKEYMKFSLDAIVE